MAVDDVINMSDENQNGAEVAMLNNNMRKNSYRPQLLQIPPSHSLDISFENVSLDVPVSTFSKSKKPVLKGVSGLFKSGELTAIMGPSGAGKSSLLNVLSGFIVNGVSGNIYTNNVLVDKKRRHIKEHSAYILQDDYLLPFFTAKEIMIHAANVKLGRSKSNKEKIILIDNIMDSMSLAEGKDTRCNRLSGGEKKRLNVCLELIDNPPVFFLDEPTSGLDSSSCGLLVSELKGLAQGGRTIICTIHQPSAAILSLFDHLYILADGKVFYQGDTSKLLYFLERINLPCPIFHNPADFVMDVANNEFGSYTDKCVSAMRSGKWRSNVELAASNNGQTKFPQDNQLFKTGIMSKLSNKTLEWQRFTYLVPQLTKQLHRDWVVTYLKLLLNAILGVFVGALFIETGDSAEKIFPNLGYIFITQTYFCFTSLMPAALRFPLEIDVLKKEHFNNWYKFTTYYLSHLVVHIPLQVVLTFIFVAPSYYLSGQALELARFFVFFGVNIHTTVFSNIIGLYMGTYGAVYGVFLGSIFIIIMCILGGFLANVNDFPLPLYIFSFVSFVRHSYEVIMTGMYGMGRESIPCPEDALYCHYKSPKIVFEDRGMDPANAIRDVIILSVLTLAVMLLTFFKIRRALKNFKH